MEEIKKLKLMLSGKAPMETSAFMQIAPIGEPIYQERIVYRDGDNK
jgi:hypothetical protein